VIDDGPDIEVLARAASLVIVSATYLAAVTRFVRRNVQFRHGARIIKRHDGGPPEPPAGPQNLRSSPVRLIGSKKMQLRGFVEAVAEPAATAAAITMFGIDAEQRRAVNPRR